MIELSPTGKRLLLYLETCLVDNCGYVQGIKMNGEDMDIVKGWAQEGIIQFDRLKFGDGTFDMANRHTGDVRDRMRRTHRVRFSDEAWQEAHRLRRERADRMCLKENEEVGEANSHENHLG